jgi:hypothetical protein
VHFLTRLLPLLVQRSAPGGRTWRACYACGSAELPVAVQAADAEVRVAVAAAMAAAADAT